MRWREKLKRPKNIRKRTCPYESKKCLFTVFSRGWNTIHAVGLLQTNFSISHLFVSRYVAGRVTDNGSECMKRFDRELKRLRKEHWHTRLKIQKKKMNTHADRFNRSVQYVDYHVPSELLHVPSELLNLNLTNATRDYLNTFLA